LKITNTLNKKERNDITELNKLCKIERVPNFDPDIYINPDLPSFYLEYKDDILIAFLSLFYVDTIEMEVIAAVHPSFRGQGYFIKLLNEANEVIPSNSTILYQVPSNYVDKDKLIKKGYTFHHGEEELINRTSADSKNVLNTLESKDIKVVAKIIADAFGGKPVEEIEFLEFLINQKNTLTLVLKKEDIVRGFIAISDSLYVNTSHVFAFCVDKDFRSKGYGKKMLCNLPSNINGYVLRVDYNNAPAKNLYKRSGFVHLSSTEYYTKS
jgi:ribosomal protein S18 acetylase RimI-like enzyme